MIKNTYSVNYCYDELVRDRKDRIVVCSTWSGEKFFKTEKEALDFINKIKNYKMCKIIRLELVKKTRVDFR